MKEKKNAKNNEILEKYRHEYKNATRVNRKVKYKIYIKPTSSVICKTERSCFFFLFF